MTALCRRISRVLNPNPEPIFWPRFHWSGAERSKTNFLIPSTGRRVIRNKLSLFSCLIGVKGQKSVLTDISGTNKISRPVMSGTNRISRTDISGTNRISRPVMSGTNRISRPVISGTNWISRPVIYFTKVNSKYMIYFTYLFYEKVK